MDWESSSSQLRDKIKAVGKEGFKELALAVFQHQARHNPLYRKYIQLLNVRPERVTKPEQIPFLPIQFFKSYDIKTGSWTPERYFTSSGTGNKAQTSRHAVRSVSWYLNRTTSIFGHYYGSIEDYCIFALLPAYLEREGSSLVMMARHFIERSKYDASGFFLYDYPQLIRQIRSCRQRNIPFILLGVSFALWELAEQYEHNMQGGIVMETGGMKGRRREITRQELHGILTQAFSVDAIHYEYGMTELLSQAYSAGSGAFRLPPTMR